jgi:hypothetical protein
MACVIWNLRRLDISPEHAERLVVDGLIYSPATPEHPQPGVFYPEDGFALSDVRRAIEGLGAGAGACG